MWIVCGAFLLLCCINLVIADLSLQRMQTLSEALAAAGEIQAIGRRLAADAGASGVPLSTQAVARSPGANPLGSHALMERTALIGAVSEGDESLRATWHRLLERWRNLGASNAGAGSVSVMTQAFEADISSFNDQVVTHLEREQRQVRFLLQGLGMVDVAVVALLMAGMRRHLVGPMGRLTDSAKRFAAGDYHGPMRIDGPAEVRMLADAMNRSFSCAKDVVQSLYNEAQAARQAEAELRALVESSGVGAYVIRANRFVYVNRQLAELMGYTAEELTGSPDALDRVHEEDRALVLNELRRARSDGNPRYQCEFRLGRRDGAYVPVEMFGTYSDLGGQATQIGTLIDLSEKKRAEELSRKLHRAVEQSPTTVVITDSRGTIEYVNPKFTQLTGYTRDEAIGQNPRIIRSDLTPPEVYRDLWHVLLSGAEWRGEVLNRKKNGELFWEHMTASPVKDGAGRITHFVAVKEDITERKHAERELRRLNRTLQVLTESNQAILQASSESELLTSTCRNLVELGGYELAYVGVACDAAASRIKLLAQYGNNDGYLELFSDEVRGAGISGACIQSQTPIIVRDIKTDPNYAQWRAEATRRGFGSGIALPLLRGNEFKGMLRIYAAEPDVFSDDEVKLLTELADDIAYGVVSLRVQEQRLAAQEALRESEERFRSISGAAQDAIIVFGGDGVVQYWNPAAESMFGYRQDDVLGQAALESLLPKRYLKDLDSRLARFRESGKSKLMGRTLAMEALRRDGTEFPVEASFSAARINGAWHAIVMARDVTSRRQAENALAVRNRAIESSSNAILITKAVQNEDDPIIYVNPAFERITGYTAEEVMGRNPRFLIGNEWDQPEIEKLRDAVRRSLPVSTRLRNRRKNGSLFWNDLSFAPVKDASGETTHFVGIINDVTEQVRYEAELRHRSTHDELTGLANRVLLSDRIEQAVAHASRTERHVAVVMIDLDRFKVINDSLGHGMGDMVIKTVAERLGRCVRRGDTVARLGGDEFVLVLAELANPSDASIVAAKVLDGLLRPVDIAGQQLFVAASIGISLAPSDGNNVEALLKNADAAMFTAKELGGNCFRYYTSGMNERAMERLSLEADLRRALERGEFVLHYQPKFSLATGKLVGAEALLRWNHPTRGMVPPLDFIPLAEETGLIVPLGNWVLHKACERANLWQSCGMSAVPIAVNISARQLRQANLPTTVTHVLAKSGLDPRWLELELTESMIMHNVDSTIAALAKLKHIGIRISIDDFGTGYSSLSYLSRFPVDALKIDRSFVRDVNTSADCRTITQTIILLAHGLGMTVVAEGVETREQLAVLQESGCDEVQGYLFSRPVPEDEFLQLVRSNTVASAAHNSAVMAFPGAAARTPAALSAG